MGRVPLAAMLLLLQVAVPAAATTLVRQLPIATPDGLPATGARVPPVPDDWIATPAGAWLPASRPRSPETPWRNRMVRPCHQSGNRVVC